MERKPCIWVIAPFVQRARETARDIALDQGWTISSTAGFSGSASARWEYIAPDRDVRGKRMAEGDVVVCTSDVVLNDPRLLHLPLLYCMDDLELSVDPFVPGKWAYVRQRLRLDTSSLDEVLEFLAS